MLTKYKSEIKGFLISSGLWIIVINVFPDINKLYNNIAGSILIGIVLVLMGWFWK